MFLYFARRSRYPRLLPPLLTALMLAVALHVAVASDYAAAAQNDVNELRYRWKEGETYSYRVSCKAEIGNVLLETNGTATYAVGQSLAGTAPPAVAELRQGSGTAFVVSADGYLLTCNHVVRGATEIKATLGDQTMPCQVVATDTVHDLALLRVPRHGLPVLPLGDSETVELAEEVRVVGYPLADVLGSSVKITQGSVAGIVSKRRVKAFQIDAMVNPGNSGGPLLNGRGAVIGVVNAQLVGQQIFKVGFAVPAHYAKPLLAQQHVAFQTAAAGAKMDGPALAKRVIPSVALVHVWCRDGDCSAPGQPRLTFHGVLDRGQRRRSPEGAPSRIDVSQRDEGELFVDEHGEITHCGGHVDLPCLLGPLGMVAIDCLPTEAGKTWQHQAMLTIKVARGGPQDPLSGIRPPGFSDRQSSPFIGILPWRPVVDPQLRYSAAQEISYAADERKGTTVVIHKRLDLKTMENDRPEPRMELHGAGETVFDLKAGVPQKLTLSGTFTLRHEGRVLQVPVTLRCERTAATEAATTAKSDAPRAAGPGTPAGSDSAAARLNELLVDLRAVDKDWNKCFRALEELRLMTPIENRRDEVAEILNGYLAEKNYSARSSALRAVQRWGTRRNVPALIRLLNPSESESLRQRAIELLAQWNDPRAATALAQRVRDPADRPAALAALRGLGQAAEDPTIALLADQDPQVRDEACGLLGEIGGTRSIAALKELAGREKGRSGTAAAALERLHRKP